MVSMVVFLVFERINCVAVPSKHKIEPDLAKKTPSVPLAMIAEITHRNIPMMRTIVGTRYSFFIDYPCMIEFPMIARLGYEQ